ncbi:nuclear receptor-binding protein-like [Heterodontus francisci]|uniref:nuclear receptor-binding protein-like n=1 Tax=Heterodontus francisci TaxID=7792 RepID=UPI00355C1AE3
MSEPERSAATPGKEEESEEESEILEESPCGRWQKRREQVRQGNVHQTESTYLAMDTEEGVEVAWNEVHFTDSRVFRIHEENIKLVFEHFMQLEHPNIVKFHKYRIDSRETPARKTSAGETHARETAAGESTTKRSPAGETHTRVIFITEYMSSGSLKQFLKKTKKNHKTMHEKAWRRWCTQILSALRVLQSCNK